MTRWAFDIVGSTGKKSVRSKRGAECPTFRPLVRARARSSFRPAESILESWETPGYIASKSPRNSGIHAPSARRRSRSGGRSTEILPSPKRKRFFVSD